MSAHPHYLQDDEALRTFLAAFEEPCLPKDAWTHAAHVAMAAVYVRRYGAEVLDPTRAAIRGFNASVGGPPTAYHETLTVLWLAIVAEALATFEAAGDVEAARYVVGLFGSDSKRHTLYYSFDVARSEAARTAWHPPDMRPIAVPFAVTAAA